MSYSNDISREIILDHIENPRNVNKNHDGYNEYTLKNPSCGDIVTVYTKLDGNMITDITYDVKGCSICIASTSMMSEILKNKTLEDAFKIIDNFNNMLTDEDYDEQIIEDAISLKGVNKIPSRIKCASLGFKAFISSLEGSEPHE